MKTFVILGESGQYNDKWHDTIYAGQDEDLADAEAVKSHHDTIQKEVWVAGVMIKGFTLNKGRNWDLDFDKVEQLKNEVEEAQKDLQDKKEKLRNIITELGADLN